MSVNSLSIKRQLDKPQRDMTMEPNESIKIYTLQEKQRQKKLTMTSCRKIVTSLPFFHFAANLEQSGSRIPDA